DQYVRTGHASQGRAADIPRGVDPERDPEPTHPGVRRRLAGSRLQLRGRRSRRAARRRRGRKIRRQSVQPGIGRGRAAAAARRNARIRARQRWLSTGSVSARSQGDRHRRLLLRLLDDSERARVVAQGGVARRLAAHPALLLAARQPLLVGHMIAMNGFLREPATLRRAELAAVERVLGSGWYILGKEVEAFEAEWASTVGVRHAVGVGNGMDAIEISLRTLGIGPGDEVITTPMTAFASVLAIIRAGALPVLADIDPGTVITSIESAKRCMSPKTRAVLLVHLYGQVGNLDVWRSFCDSSGVHLVEDCAQAHLAAWKGVTAG